jgi:hypothetical protein
LVVAATETASEADMEAFCAAMGEVVS